MDVNAISCPPVDPRRRFRTHNLYSDTRTLHVLRPNTIGDSDNAPGLEHRRAHVIPQVHRSGKGVD